LAEERILVIQLRQLGDILLTTPCLRAIKRERPKARLTFLSHAMGGLVLDHCPSLDEHFSYDGSWTKRQEWKLACTLRERRFDLVFDFMDNPRSAFYAWMTGAPRRVGFRSARRPAYTLAVPRPPEPRYIVHEKFALLQAAGFLQGEVLGPRPPPTPDQAGARAEAAALARDALILPWFEAQTQPLLRLIGANPQFRAAPLRVALSPTHRRPARRWPLERYAAIADRLTREWGAVVLWIYGPGEEAAVDQAMALCQEATLKAPRTNFREMAALIGNVDLFIGNSNGPSHVAVAAGICSLQLHGHTTASSWCPMTERHRAVQSPDYGRTDRTMDQMMQAVTVEAVWAAIEAMRPTVETYAATVRRPRLTWRS
jgi:heptosyltransferase-3